VREGNDETAEAIAATTTDETAEEIFFFCRTSFDMLFARGVQRKPIKVSLATAPECFGAWLAKKVTRCVRDTKSYEPTNDGGVITCFGRDKRERVAR
jgi:hypothetical protein